MNPDNKRVRNLVHRAAKAKRRRELEYRIYAMNKLWEFRAGRAEPQTFREKVWEWMSR